VKPLAFTAARNSASEGVVPGRRAARTAPLPRSTRTRVTPGTRMSCFSTFEAQSGQLIPLTHNVSSGPLSGSGLSAGRVAADRQPTSTTANASARATPASLKHMAHPLTPGLRREMVAARRRAATYPAFFFAFVGAGCLVDALAAAFFSANVSAGFAAASVVAGKLNWVTCHNGSGQ